MRHQSNINHRRMHITKKQTNHTRRIARLFPARSFYCDLVAWADAPWRWCALHAHCSPAWAAPMHCAAGTRAKHSTSRSAAVRSLQRGAFMHMGDHGTQDVVVGMARRELQAPRGAWHETRSQRNVHRAAAQCTYIGMLCASRHHGGSRRETSASYFVFLNIIPSSRCADSTPSLPCAALRCWSLPKRACKGTQQRALQQRTRRSFA